MVPATERCVQNNLWNEDTPLLLVVHRVSIIGRFHCSTCYMYIDQHIIVWVRSLLDCLLLTYRYRTDLETFKKKVEESIETCQQDALNPDPSDPHGIRSAYYSMFLSDLTLHTPQYWAHHGTHLPVHVFCMKQWHLVILRDSYFVHGASSVNTHSWPMSQSAVVANRARVMSV